MSDNIFDRMVTDAEEVSSVTSDRVESADCDAGSHQNTATDVKRSTQELLRHGSLEESQKRDLFRLVMIHRSEISAVLEPLDLELRIDEHRGVAFLQVAQSAYENRDDADVWTHP